MKFRLALAFSVLAVPAFAQQPVQPQLGCDPRVCAQMINALQAMLALREAEIRATGEDNRSAAATLAYWQDACNSTPECGGPKPAASNDR